MQHQNVEPLRGKKGGKGLFQPGAAVVKVDLQRAALLDKEVIPQISEQGRLIFTYFQNASIN